MDAMRARWWALAAAVWTVVYLVGYLILVNLDGNGPAWWYVGLLVVGVTPLIAASAGRSSRPTLIASAVLLGFAALLGLLSIGILLVPAVVCAVVAAIATGPGSSALRISQGSAKPGQQR